MSNDKTIMLCPLCGGDVNVNEEHECFDQYKVLEDIHILPTNDLKPHQENENCGCKPKIEIIICKICEKNHGHLHLNIIIHNSYDGREFYEKNNKS